MQTSNQISLLDRIISAITYITTSWVGIIWLIIMLLMKKNVKPFVMYHIFQSIFLSFSIYVIMLIYSWIYIIIVRIPLIKMIPIILNSSIPILGGLSILQAFISVVFLYLAITALLGYYSYLPYISNIIRRNFR